MQTKKVKKSQKMTLKDYFESLDKMRLKSPRQEFIEEVSARCGVTQNTVRIWLKRKPTEEIHIRILEEITGIERSELWK